MGHVGRLQQRPVLALWQLYNTVSTTFESCTLSHRRVLPECAHKPDDSSIAHASMLHASSCPALLLPSHSASSTRFSKSPSNHKQNTGPAAGYVARTQIGEPCQLSTFHEPLQVLANSSPACRLPAAPPPSSHPAAVPAAHASASHAQ